LKAWKKIALSLAALLLVLVVAGVEVVVGWRALLFGPRARALTARRFEATPERLARGRYLVETRHACVFCHSEREWRKPGAPPRADRLGAGVVWSVEGMPWLTASNITPDAETGIGQASDDALVRAVREGIGLDGRALFPVMPYQDFRRIPDEDMAAIVVYVRSLAPVRSALPPTRLPFPLGLIVRGLPQPIEGAVAPPDLKTPEKRGEYVLRTAACHDCHTPRRNGRLDMSLDMSGGNPVKTHDGVIAAVNLTLDPTGIANYDEAVFVKVMQTGKFETLHATMPWVAYSGMSEEDLRAIWAYLKTLKKVAHVVTNGPNPTPCRICGASHGGGDKN
jgi:mono/diheme cytochrome c family protein